MNTNVIAGSPSAAEMLEGCECRRSRRSTVFLCLAVLLLPTAALGDVAAPAKPALKATDRRGPDRAPAVSPDGKHVAYLGFDDKRLGYQATQLYLAHDSRP